MKYIQTKPHSHCQDCLKEISDSEIAYKTSDKQGFPVSLCHDCFRDIDSLHAAYKGRVIAK